MFRSRGQFGRAQVGRTGQFGAASERREPAAGQRAPGATGACGACWTTPLQLPARAALSFRPAARVAPAAPAYKSSRTKRAKVAALAKAGHHFGPAFELWPAGGRAVESLSPRASRRATSSGSAALNLSQNAPAFRAKPRPLVSVLSLALGWPPGFASAGASLPAETGADGRAEGAGSWPLAKTIGRPSRDNRPICLPAPKRLLLRRQQRRRSRRCFVVLFIVARRPTPSADAAAN